MDTQSSQVSLSGSCHCGSVRYIVRLMFPHATNDPDSSNAEEQEFYRCNCTVCHKSGHFHVRPVKPTDDFLLLSPLDPFAELGDYQCFGKKLHFFFCRTCGVRPFVFAGDGEVVEVKATEVRTSNERSEPADHEKLIKVWRPKRGDDPKPEDHYLSVNGHTIDSDQDAFDMRVLSEKKQVLYVDCLSEPEGPSSYDRPPHGGCY